MAKDERAAPCGTEAAYNRHRRKGQTPCQDCKRAAAQARARRRGKSSKDDTPMAQQAAELPGELTAEGSAGDPEVVNFKVELKKLYGVLGVALKSAAPRETASIVKEMRGVLHDLKVEYGPQQNGPSLKEQLAQAKRERAAKEEKRKMARLAGKDAGEESA